MYRGTSAFTTALLHLTHESNFRSRNDPTDATLAPGSKNTSDEGGEIAPTSHTQRTRGTQLEHHLLALRLLLMGATYTKRKLVACSTHHCYDLPMAGGGSANADADADADADAGGGGGGGV